MKTEFTEVSETRKHLSFEIPPDVVDAEITRVAKGYSKNARVPGFRPGKVPAHVVKQRYRDQILSDVANDLIPRVVGTALKERGLQPVAMPDIRDVVMEEGRPLTFVADFETLPPIEPGEYVGLTLRKPPAVLEVGARDRALEELQQRATKWHPVEDRASEIGDALLMDLTRTRQRHRGSRRRPARRRRRQVESSRRRSSRRPSTAGFFDDRSGRGPATARSP
jgi:trigger factor